MIIAEPNSVTFYNKIEAYLYILKQEDGGDPFKRVLPGQHVHLYFKFAQSQGKIFVPHGFVGKHGDHFSAKLEILHPLPFIVGSNFCIKDAGRLTIVGIVTKLLPNDQVLEYEKQE